MTTTFLRTQGGNIVDGKNKAVRLRGVNFGGWLMMEAYFMHAPNRPEQLMKSEFAKTLGKTALAALERSFRGNFIQASDMRQVAQWGFNCVRLPFHYRVAQGHAEYLDQAIRWAKSCGVYVILDLHAAPGAQNNDWHSDSLGEAALWTKMSNRRRVYELWEFLADRYKDEPTVAGYDVLNEPVLDDTAVLNQFYRQTIKAIRNSDKKHMLFIEGNRWAQDIAPLDEFKDDNWVYSMHFYEPLEYTFNFVPHLRYPLRSKAGTWGKTAMRGRLQGYYDLAKERERPVHVGEFGVNFRKGHGHEDIYLRDLVACFDDFGFHWNYWTYKAIKHFMFPDGIYSYYPNPPWVNRPGPVTGWNRWKDFWPKHKKEMTRSWQTQAFTLNAPVLKELREK